MLLLSPGLPDASLAKVALDCSLEDLLRYGYKNPGMLASRVLSHDVAHARNIPVFALGKQTLDECLAAEPFVLL